MNKTKFEEYRTDVLFLLVGANPLPNYVATLLLADTGAKIYLLHTNQTLKVAQRLQSQIERKRSDLTFELREIDRTDGNRIEIQVESLARALSASGIEGHRVGLNYSGGTKPMAVHTYRALQAAFPEGVFSYLDADRLELAIQRRGMPTQTPFAGQEIPVDFKTLFALHGCRSENTSPDPAEALISLCQSIFNIQLDETKSKQWQAWIKSLSNPDPQLPSPDEFPALMPVIQELDALCGSKATPEMVARKLGYENGKLKSCSKFFIGDWLEILTFRALKEIAETCELNDAGWGLKFLNAAQGRRDDKSDLDVAALRGYQLFAISCIATAEKGKAKEHLFEIFVRARQLGGDEARLALVCLYKDSGNLKKELSGFLGTQSKIAVFGQAELPQLSQYLADWIKTASSERG